MLFEQMVLFVLGIVFLLLGFCFMGWGITQKRIKAGSSPGDFEGVAKILEELGKLVDIIAKHVPNAAVGLGLLMMIVGLFLILFVFIIPVIPALAAANATGS
jgi:hypothetical protein